jgi:protein-L-isoaspartate(D-aspartate) O-methyltransferase
MSYRDGPTAMNVEFAREQMIGQQVQTWHVLDERVLDAMRAVPRERFVPAAYRDVAFADAPIPIAHQQSMLPASFHGRILQALAVAPGDVALEVGAGTGYLTACLARLAARVRAFELFADLAQEARSHLLATATNNASVEVTDGMQLDEQDAFDVIAVTGSLPLYDERFQRALKIGGRLFVVVGMAPVMEAWKITRAGEREWQRETLFETVVDPLVNAPRPSAFVF